MRRKFSDKYGYTKPREILQLEDIDKRLKNRIWNTIENSYLNLIITSYEPIGFSDRREVFRNPLDYKTFEKLYDEYLAVVKKPSKDIKLMKKEIRQLYITFEWYDIYNFIEALVYYTQNEKLNEHFKDEVNIVLESEMSGYRFIGDCIAPIIDEVETKEIENVFDTKYETVKMHLSKGLELLSDRESPDYQNSIKESISAVESIAQVITGTKKDLGACIKIMDLDVQKQFTKTLSGLYSWTCQEDGMRHAHTGEELKTGFDEAKFMLVSCSTFINYLISKYEEK